jgi:murein DD-endopeptidase MepM/ murein hydrolase activator NlpD
VSAVGPGCVERSLGPVTSAGRLGCVGRSLGPVTSAGRPGCVERSLGPVTSAGRPGCVGRSLGPVTSAGRLARIGALLTLTVGTAACAIPRWPLAGPVTSDYGLRFRGMLPELHRGVDIAVPIGTQVRTMAPGTIRFAGVQSGYGNVVWVDHGGEVLSVYGHLSEIHVRQGEVVDVGTLLGLSGDTGDVTAPHLHFEVWRWGRERDPVALLGGYPR